MRRTLIAMALLVVPLFSQQACSRVSTPERMPSFCELAEHGAEWRGQHVRFEATYVTDMEHYARLSSADCRDSAIQVSASTAAAPGSNEFWNAFYDAMRAKSRVPRFGVDVSGRFDWSESQTPHGKIQIERIWSFRQTQDAADH
jgi:hypothetical protein